MQPALRGAMNFQQGRNLMIPHNYITAYHARTSAPQQAVSVLKLGAKAVKLGIRAAAAPLLRLVGHVAGLQACLSNEELLRALAQAARALDTAAVLTPLQQLICNCMASNTAGCVDFILELDHKPQLQQQWQQQQQQISCRYRSSWVLAH
jgi:hypothetical protein